MECDKEIIYHLHFVGLFINDLANYIKQLNKGINVRGENISILLFADDMVLIAKY